MSRGQLFPVVTCVAAEHVPKGVDLCILADCRDGGRQISNFWDCSLFFNRSGLNRPDGQLFFSGCVHRVSSGHLADRRLGEPAVSRRLAASCQVMSGSHLETDCFEFPS